ncbi:MAG: phage/plasmid primase, P4 family [Thermodesulfobacteriota bacterium]
MTDLGNAERLVAYCGEDIRYCHRWGAWLIWNGKIWELDKTLQINGKAKEVVRNIYKEASQASDSAERTAISRHAEKSESESRIRSMINLAKCDQSLAVHPEDLDQNHWLLTCLNGTIDLRTGKLLKHDRKHLITQIAPAEYDPNATCPTWKSFLDKILAGNDNLISFLQRAVGYSLTGDTSEQCLFIFHGSGANGKSTFLQAISSMLGEHAMQTPTETLLVKRKGAIPNDVARLKGARLVTASEAETDQRLAEGLIKQMTGQDTLSARFLHQEWFDFKPTHKIFLATNHKPTITGIDPAIWRRIKLIPFDVTIPEHKRDKKLLSKLEAELSGILAWAVRGCLDWRDNGLGIPVEVRTATDQYKIDMDVMAQFLSDCCDIQPKESVSSKNLYAAYLSWCEEVGEEPLKQRNFGLKLKEKGYKNNRNRDGRYWKGLNLLPVTHLAPVTHGDATNHVFLHDTGSIGKTCDLASHVSHPSSISQNSCVNDQDRLM